MPAPPIPVDRYLTPADPPAAPDGFATLAQKIMTGIPQPITLDANFTAVLAVPTGLGGEWQQADPSAVVSVSTVQTDPCDPAANPVVSAPVCNVERSTARLLIQRDGTNVASIPLTAGSTFTVPADGGTAAGRLEVSVLSWDLRAGSMIGPGDYGSTLTLAWRRNDTGVQTFGPVPLNPFLRLRLPPSITMRSVVSLNLAQAIYDRLRITIPRVLR
ncbi:hypothetical protein LMG28688_06248 [Paraburkholderia caffeinitolerans]|uniref:Uncharacterized protein n=1 Tax=Paraburkholderia caffeinitolerans TaxID=1723730 RepID=A0A6J5GRN6_9BURK|nr:hypothetical protein [Paraburkholderia caffeinitolerans]CAB3805754.1 hypothetical protein LMG28688_06248 [Paraburkholderia caffeinitolerans]